MGAFWGRESNRSKVGRAASAAARLEAATKEEAVRAHFAAIVDVVYQRLAPEQKVDVDKIDDPTARASAVAGFRAEHLSQCEMEAESLDEFRICVSDYEETLAKQAELLSEARANGDLQPHL